MEKKEFLLSKRRESGEAFMHLANNPKEQQQHMKQHE